MKRKLWIRIGAVVLAALLLWWLFWAILIDEDGRGRNRKQSFSEKRTKEQILVLTHLKFVLLFFCLKINIHFASVFSEIISIFASLTN